MNRAIKFRAWDTQHTNGDGTQVRPKMLDWNVLSNMVMWAVERQPGGGKQDRYKFMQYTGLQDKNEKEIFEGDYLSDGLFKVLVEWGESGWVCGDQDLWTFTEEGRYAVVGNQWES